MSESKERFLSLLFEEGRELKNLKFFPGPNCGSADELYDAAHKAISAAMVSEDGDMIPSNGAKSVSIAELVESI